MANLLFYKQIKNDQNTVKSIVTVKPSLIRMHSL
nr:MAG TPA: hypothetical protein [Caudoviricetes sp.]